MTSRDEQLKRLRRDWMKLVDLPELEGFGEFFGEGAAAARCLRWTFVFTSASLAAGPFERRNGA
jgi:hypothetical protein